MGASKIAIVGAGAQGAGIGADLVRAGLDVTFVEQWPAHVEAMQDRGLTVHTPDGTLHVPVTARHLCEVAELRDDFDLVFIMVKAYDTRWVTELIASRLHSDSLVVGLQNGMTLPAIASIVGSDRAAGGVLELGSNMFEPGVVQRENRPENSWFALGAQDPVAGERIAAAAAALRHAGIVEVSEDIHSSKWMKLIANAGELVPSAILDLSLTDAARTPVVHEFMVRCGQEATAAALLDGASLVPIFGMDPKAATNPASYAQSLLDEVVDTFASPTTLTTVLQDWMKGRRSELHDLNGHVVSVLHAHGRPARSNQRVVELGAEIEAGTRTRGMHNLPDLLASSGREGQEPASD